MKSQPLESDPSGDALSPVCDWIVGLFLEKLHIEVPSVDTDLMETGVLDSLALVELLVHLEQGLGIKIPLADLDLENFRSIVRIAEFVGVRGGAGRRNGFENPT